MSHFIEKIRNLFGGVPAPVYCHYTHRLQKYTVLQVVKAEGDEPEPDTIGVIYFDWTGDSPISAKEFKGLKPYRLRFRANRVDFSLYEPVISRTMIHVGDFPRKYVIKSGGEYRFRPIFESPAEYEFLFAGLPPLEEANYRKESGILDLRGKARHITIADSTLDEILINPEIARLTFENTMVNRVTDPGQGRILELAIHSDHFLIPGLEKLTRLDLIVTGDIDLRQLADYYPELEYLHIYGRYGTLSGFDALKRLPNLEMLRCFDMFGFDGSDMPAPEEAPSLCCLLFSGLPQTAARQIKALWQGVPGVICDIKKARKPEWIEENRDNPFSDWDGREGISAARAKKAFEIYKNAKKQVIALAERPQPERDAAFTRIAGDIATSFNEMNKRNAFIETLEREEIYEVVVGLLHFGQAQYGLSEDTESLLAAFDGERDW